MLFPPRLRVSNKEQPYCQPLLTTKRAHFDLGWWGSGHALERGERFVVLEALANERGSFRTDQVILKTARAKQGGIKNCQPLLTRKRAHSELGWWGSERALECGKCLVDLEGLANVLGALVANFVVLETARVKQGATTTCQPLLTRKRAHSELGWWGSERALECDCEGRTRSSHTLSAPADNKASTFDLGCWGSERALELGEDCVDLEGLADVLGAFRADSVVAKTARAKQGAITAVSPC
eukprot:scaffold4613_cov129-Isochrysis_galbana.AAC.20